MWLVISLKDNNGSGCKKNWEKKTMVYAMSDLHGCYNLYIKMLEKINFSDNDTLYILGDIVDRGPDGIKIFQDMMKRKNVVGILGNHDYTALRMFKTIYNKEKSDSLLLGLAMWKLIGGAPTNDAFISLSEPERIQITNYISGFPIFKEIKVNGNNFWLSHSVPTKKHMLKTNHLEREDFIVGAPEYDKKYFEDKYIVTGHTPTLFIDSKYEGKIYKKNNHIAIDCGAVFDGNLGCICLDNFKEFYVI